MSFTDAAWRQAALGKQPEGTNVDNQHRHIKGYRELSQAEIDLMNRIKTKGAELLALQAELSDVLSDDYEYLKQSAWRSIEGQEVTGCPATIETGDTPECIEYRRFQAAEPLRWSAIGKTDAQTAIMALVRAVAQPAGV